MKKLIIVDLFGIIFKAYYTFFHTPLNTSKGESSSTIYGFFRIFMSAIRKFSPNYLIIASESKTETFRHKLYKEYKSHRKDKPEDLKAQISVIIKILQAFQFPLISEEGFEADDIIGSICEKYKNHKDLEILILSQDKDIHQLIRKNIHIISSIKGFSEFIEYDEKKSLKKWDIPTNQIIDYLALIGDPSDNIPGGKGIGPKTALSILNDFKSLNEIYQNLDHFKPAIRKKLLTSKQNIFLSQKLVTIKTDIPLNIPIEDCEMPSIHLSKEGIEYFQHYEFSSLIKDIPKIFEKNGAISQTTLKCYNEINSNYQLITTQKEFFLLIENLKKCQYLSIDIETDSLDIITAKIIGISFCTEKNSAFFLPIPSKENRFPSKWIENEKLQTSDLKQNLIFSELKKILEDKKIKKIGQNIKFDYMIIKNQAGIDMQNIYFDTMIASFILHPNFERHNLDFLAEKFLDYKTIYYSEIIPKKDLTLKDIEIEKVSIYAAEDADISFQIYQKLSPVINYSEMKYLFYSIEMPLLKILGNMQLYGVGVDIKYWKNLYKKLDLKINDLEKRIFDIVKEKFNINSPKQLSNILFKKLNLKPKRKTKTDYSTDNETLNTLKKQSEAIPLILSYRTLNKICTTYLSLKYIHTNTNRIHTTYNQVKTRTGRLSSSSPNLQNIPNEHHKTK